MIYILVGLFLAYLFYKWWNEYDLPPGPWSVPMLGSIPFIGKDLRKEALRLSQELKSDVISLKIGPQVLIVLNTFESIKAAFASDNFLDRPNNMLFLMMDKMGLGSSDGRLWKVHRRLSLSILRDFGMGKMAAEDKIREECRHLADEIGKHCDEDFRVGPLLSIATANVISATILGSRYDYTDKEFLYCVTRFKENLAIVSNTSMLMFYPWLRHVPGNIFNFGTIMRNLGDIRSFLGKHIRTHKKELDPNNMRDFLDAYLVEQRRHEGKETEYLWSDKQVRDILVDLLSAGSETSATTVEWSILYMMAFPEIQKRVQAEIDSVVGKDHLATMGDRSQLPYTEATVLETHRFCTLTGLGLPHCNLQSDVEFSGYRIPKGAQVLGNIWAVHRDPNIWKNPDKFDPTNFLDSEGEVAHTNELIPFLVGRRQCPGEGLARMEVFLMFTTLMQRFSFSLPEGAPAPNMEGVFLTTNTPHPFQAHISLRQ